MSGRKFGHNHKELLKRAARHGLGIDTYTKAVLEFVWSSDLPIESRYIMTGYKQRISLGDLAQTVANIRSEVNAALTGAGVSLAPILMLDGVTFPSSHRTESE